MIDMGIIEPCDNKLKPYTIIKNKEEIRKIMEDFRKSHDVHGNYTLNLHDSGANRRYARNGI